MRIPAALRMKKKNFRDEEAVGMRATTFSGLPWKKYESAEFYGVEAEMKISSVLVVVPRTGFTPVPESRRLMISRKKLKYACMNRMLYV